MQALGFGAAVAVAPALAGAMAVWDALQDPDLIGLRSTLCEPSDWIGASALPPPPTGSFHVRYRIPLWVSRVDSHLPDHELAGILAEINTIWSQAGISFTIRDADSAEVPDDELVLRFIGGCDDLPVFGMYDGNRDLWTHDRPDLLWSPHPVTRPAARTASHELGHALSLEHYDYHHDSIDSLMASGHRGFRLHLFEIARARQVGRSMGEAIQITGEPVDAAQSASRRRLTGRTIGPQVRPSAP